MLLVHLEYVLTQIEFISFIWLLSALSGLLQILEQLDKFNLKPEPAKGLVKGAALIVSIMQKDQVATMTKVWIKAIIVEKN